MSKGFEGLDLGNPHDEAWGTADRALGRVHGEGGDEGDVCDRDYLSFLSLRRLTGATTEVFLAHGTGTADRMRPRTRASGNKSHRLSRASVPQGKFSAGRRGVRTHYGPESNLSTAASTLPIVCVRARRFAALSPKPMSLSCRSCDAYCSSGIDSSAGGEGVAAGAGAAGATGAAGAAGAAAADAAAAGVATVGEPAVGAATLGAVACGAMRRTA